MRKSCGIKLWKLRDGTQRIATAADGIIQNQTESDENKQKTPGDKAGAGKSD